jgi:hypothetical protein
MMSFSLSGGVEIFGFISPSEPTDDYPVIDPLYGIDGFRNVRTISELNAIPDLRRRAGMVVGINNGSTYYRLLPGPWNGTITDWTIFQTGGGTTFTGGTVTGPTLFLGGLSATTFSASTYLGLPLDVYVTGFTFNPVNYNLSIEQNNGSILTQNLSSLSTNITISGGTGIITGGTSPNFTITNSLPDQVVVLNNGSNINITGTYPNFTISTTGISNSDTYVTGFTYNDNTFTISNNSGLTYSATIDSVTGLTVNGNLISQTISASTYQNLPIDVYVTGGTYSDGTLILTNNTGGTFNVVGFYTGETNYVNSLTTGTGLSANTTTGDITIVNTNPDQIVTLTEGSNIDITGTYPNFTIAVTGLTDNNTFTTGFTYNNNTFTISNNSGNTFNATINSVTGLTVNGNLSVTGNTNVKNITGTTALFSGSGQNIVTIIGSGSTSPLFTIQGSSGELFSITDSLIGSLFSVNDISGLPILEVFSDNTILIGDYLSPSLNTTKKVSAGIGTTTIYSIPVSAYTGAFFDYTVSDGTNLRSGNIMSIFNSSNVRYSETSTTDIGNTSGITFNMVISGGTSAVLQTSGTTSGWTVKTIVRSI